MKPRSLITTLFGDYIQFYGWEIWVGSLIEMLGKFGISESSVRGAILRMNKQDLLTVRKVGNKSYYTVSPKGKLRIEDGVKRVYSIGNNKWDGNWRIVSYSMPEEMRDLRNQVRKELTWIGFGMLSNSVWISPNYIEKQVMDMISHYKLEDYTVLFSSSTIISHKNEEIIYKAWDLNTLSKEYESFIHEFQGKYDYFKEKAWEGRLSDEECFIERTRLVHEYRKFLFKDPGFPYDLLPADWIGIRAKELFFNIHQLISIGAVRYFETVFVKAPDLDAKVQREKALSPFSDI
ncbi:PaaX family transcriptional regulator [Calidifontibacillus oryziterrae]|uniref:PaaX family transcriptional regulator n=1 Tax=Calidifontibacillus oryziterrae TaxID=1191699 RepID=UPI0002E73FBC|nr:PaaX family transcriptional regulator C-terminal domain-containing protein [Calidifontibacillus oryziterrae]